MLGYNNSMYRWRHRFMEVTQNRTIIKREPQTETETDTAHVLHCKAVAGTTVVVMGVVVHHVPQYLANWVEWVEPRAEVILIVISGDVAPLPDGAPRPANNNQHVWTDQPLKKNV